MKNRTKVFWFFFSKKNILYFSWMIALSVAPARAAPRDAALVAQVQAYLNGIHALKARFTQVAPDGAETTGTAWLWRPGRMRFQYDSPSPLLLVAGDGKVIFRDNALDQTSSLPLSSSPLGILLAPAIDLGPGGGVSVQSVQRLPGEAEVTLARTGAPDQGELTLIFATDPLQLRSWVVTDAQHDQTKVSLSDVTTGDAGFDPSLFAYRDPNLPASR
jgi:outer membrane lipoprotein-sorting protein